MSTSNSQTSQQMKDTLRMIGLSYLSIGKSLGVSDVTVRSVLIGKPGQHCGPDLRKRIWQKVKVAKSEATSKIAKIKIPEGV